MALVARALADRCDVRLHQTAIAKVELGTRPLRVDEVYALAAVLSVDPEHLLSNASWRDRDVDVLLAETRNEAEVLAAMGEAHRAAEYARAAVQRFEELRADRDKALAELATNPV